jgi:hypothetical protein
VQSFLPLKNFLLTGQIGMALSGMSKSVLHSNCAPLYLSKTPIIEDKSIRANRQHIMEALVYLKHLREWLFHSQTGVGVRNSWGVGVGTGVGVNNLLGVDLGVNFYCLNFALALATNAPLYKLIYRKYVYNMYI